MNVTIYEKMKLISDAIGAGRSKEEIDKLLSDKCIMQAADMTYNKNITWLVPETDPPYIPNNDSEQIMAARLRQEWDRMGIFLSIGNYVNMKQVKREALYIEMLQVVDPKDAQLILAMRKGKLPFKNLSRKFFETQYPNLKAHWELKNG